MRASSNCWRLGKKPQPKYPRGVRLPARPQWRERTQRLRGQLDLLRCCSCVGSTGGGDRARPSEPAEDPGSPVRPSVGCQKRHPPRPDARPFYQNDDRLCRRISIRFVQSIEDRLHTHATAHLRLLRSRSRHAGFRKSPGRVGFWVRESVRIHDHILKQIISRIRSGAARV